jgi:hypothetical protein
VGESVLVADNICLPKGDLGPEESVAVSSPLETKDNAEFTCKQIRNVSHGKMHKNRFDQFH